MISALMKYFLAKTEPTTYSIDNLERDKQTIWDGIRNPQALHAVRQMQPGDRVFIYHSAGQSAVAGLAEVISSARPDPKDPENPKLAVIDLRFLRKLDPPTTLTEIKQSGKFADWSLVRQGRLSTMAAPESFVRWLRSRYAGEI